MASHKQKQKANRYLDKLLSNVKVGDLVFAANVVDLSH